MKGQSKYDIPDSSAMTNNLMKIHTEKKRQLVEDMAKNKNMNAGELSVEHYYEK